MNKRSLITIMCLVVVLFLALSVSSASDAVDNMTIGSDDQNPLEVDDSQDLLGEGESSFEQLDNVIQSESPDGLIELNNSYAFSDSDIASVGTGGITIDKDITIDGKGYTLDASNKASIFRISNNAHVILKDIIFTNGNATDGGAVYVESGSTVEIIDCTFQNNLAANNGGAIFIAGDSLTLTSSINNSNFINNLAGNGGAVYVTSSTLNVAQSGFSYNNATGYGGSIYSSGTVHISETIFDHESAKSGGAIELFYDGENYSTIENSTFKNCFANGDGGAAYIRSNNVIVENVMFLDNVAGDDGGAIYWEGDNGLMYNITCVNNMGISIDKGDNDTSSTRGGTICLTGDNVTVKGSSFTSSSAYMDDGKDSSKVDGGALFVTGNDVTIEDVTFTDCLAVNNGGAVYVIGNRTKILNCDFSDSHAKDGAALYVDGFYCELRDSTFFDNVAGDDGGAIYWDGDNGLMYNITCINNIGASFNTSSSRGGTICLTGDNVTVKKSSFTSGVAYIDDGKNSSKVDGGALFVTGNGIVIDEVTFTDCIAVNNGGAVYIIGNDTQILNCGFSNCNAKDGAALYVNGGGCQLYNSTFTDNTAEDDGGAIYWDGDNGLMYNITCVNNRGVSFNTSSSRGGTICLTGDNVTVKKSSFSSSSVSIAEGRDFSKIDGGAIFITGNNINIIETEFEDCNAVNGGGAVYIIGNNTQLIDCTYLHTKALVGGAIYVAGDDAVVDDSLFRYNDAKGAKLDDGGTGGAVYVDGERTIISNSDFAFDTAVRYGGAISVWGPDAIITNNIFDNSSTTLFHGGAIFVNGFNATISQSNFTRSKTLANWACGGAIEISGDAANIRDCNFDDCYAYYGGDIHVNGVDAVIDNSNFEHGAKYNDKYSYEGGAIYVAGTNTTILKSNFTEFTSEENGGAIYISGTHTNISESNFKECNANGPNKNNGGWGGAIYIAGENTNIEKSNFSSCNALRTNSQGGAICIQGANTVIKESAFENCEARKGGDIYVFGNLARIEDSTFNSSNANYGGAIYLEAWGAFIKQADITECYAANNGGAIYVAGGGTNIVGGSFEECWAEGTASTNGGGAIYIDGPDTHISGADFNNNHVLSNARGGTIYIKGVRTIIDGSCFNDSYANEGGVIFIEGEDAIIDSSVFANSTSKVYGGAISVHGQDTTIRGSHFENVNCYRDGNYQSKGGAIYVDGSNTDILTSSFKNCTAKTDGGAIYIDDIETTVAYSNFTQCHATTGGAIFIKGDNTTVTYSNLENNTASTAGAIQITGTGTLISNSNLNNNTANTAGAIKVAGSDTLVSDCNMTYNFAIAGSGGAMDLSGKNASVRFSWFDHNDARDYGGAINWDGGHGEDSIIGSTFTNNAGHGRSAGGGAIFWTAGDPGKIGSGGLIKDSEFINNSADHHGGAIDWYHSLDSKIDNCLFVNNKAKNGDGGALYTGDQKGGSYNFTISNSQFYNNTAAKHGGAIANQMEKCLIVNNVFDGNKASSSGGTILMKEASSVYPGGKDSIIDHCYIYNSFCDIGDTWGASGGAIHIGANDKNVTISNCEIINSTCARAYGGAISVKSPGSSLINVTIQNAQTSDGYGGSIYWSGKDGTFSNVTIFNSSSHAVGLDRPANGGAIYLAGSNCNLDVITIITSSSNIENQNVWRMGYGGAIYVDGEDNTITNLVIDDSRTSSPRMNAHGGAIYWSGTSGTLINATISNTLANGQGGAIYWSGSSPVVENISIEYSQTNVTNMASYSADGGAIYTTTIDDLKNVYIVDALASTNSGNVRGGAIYYEGSKMTNVTVIGSRASTDEGTSYAGAVYCKYASNIYDSLFENNTADYGGAIFSDKALYIGGTSFIGNVALEGGALYSQTGAVTLNDVLFELNSAKKGGALFVQKVNFYITNSTFKNNTAEEKGGALYYVHKDGSSYIRNTDLVNNTAFQGSAIYTNKFFELTNVILLDNQANSKEFIDKHVGVDGTGRNYTSGVFVGFDNLLNAIWDEESIVSIACNNVTYWGVNGVNVSNSVPRRSDREVWQKVIVETFNGNGEKINEANVTTDGDGRFIYYFDATPGETYYFAYTHPNDRYYTYLRDTLSNRSLVKVYVYNPLFYNQNQTILISLTDGAWGNLNGTVNVTLIGPVNRTYEINVTNGTYTISNISGLPLGTYNVTASFAGDLDHTGSSDWVEFIVLPYDDLHVTKVVNVTADYVNVSDIIEYTINVTNHGPSGAQGVNVTEVLSPYLKMLTNQTTKGYYNYTKGIWFIGDLDVNETVTLTITAQIIHSGPILNSVWVTGLGNDTNLTNNMDSARNFTALSILDLRITKDVNVTKDPINVLDIIKFTVTVFNDGPSDATGVVVGEVLDFHLKLISNTTTVGNFSKGTWNIGRLANGANATLTIIAQVIYSGNITNFVNVTCFENETDYTNNNASIKNFTAIANVDVGINKTVNVTGFVNVTDLIQFNITVYNNGPCNATGVYVTEILDYAHLEIMSNTTTRGDYDGFSWIIGDLNKGEVLNLTIIAKVIDAGSFGNVVSILTIDNDTNPDNNNDSIDNITALPIVDLEITKEVTMGGNIVNVTDEIAFTIKVTNHGPCTATNVTVMEILSPHLHMTENSTWMGYYNVTTGIWYIGDLHTNESVSLVIKAIVISNGTIANVVVVNSTENDTNKSNNNDTIDNITALPIVDLVISKEVNVAVVNVTGRIIFTINVTNNGPSNATHVNVIDVLGPNLKLVSNATDKGYYNRTEGIWHIGNLNNQENATLTLVCDVVREGLFINQANVTSHENDTNPYNNHAEATYKVLPIVDVEITKTVNVTAKYVAVKDLIEFTITVHNNGPSNATGVYVGEIITSPLIIVSSNASVGNYTDGTWFIGNLNNNATETLTIVCQAMSSANITNFVNVTSYQNDTNMSNNYDNITNLTALPLVDLEITKRVDFGSGTVEVGDLVQFTINVVNHGPCDATGVNVTEVLSPHLKMTNYLIFGGKYNVTSGIWDIGNLPNKGVAQLIIQAIVISNGTISNYVVVSSNENDTNESNNNDTIDNITALPLVDLEISKEVNVAVVNVTGRIIFTINVTNNGPSNATNVNVTDVLGPNLNMVSNVTTKGYYNKTAGVWYVGKLENNTNATLTIVCDVVREGLFINQANVTCYENDTNPYNNHAEVTYKVLPIVDVEITKTVNVTSTFVDVGDFIEFTITVHNKGPSNATGVYVGEIITSPLIIISSNASVGNYADGTWSIGNLNNNATETLTIVCQVMDIGDISNFVNVTSYQNDTNMSNNYDNITNMTTYDHADVEITKRVDFGSGTVKVGDLVQFTIDVVNHGPCAATNVTVTEVLSPHLHMTTCLVYGGSYNVTSGIWYIGNMTNKGVAQLIIQAVVISNGTISNYVVVTSNDNDTNKSNNNDTIDNITALPIVDLVISKEVNVAVVNVTGRIIYTINVTNRGPSNATQVNVSEVLGPNLSMVSNVTTKGYYNLTAGVWYIGKLDNNTNATLTLVCDVVHEGIITNYVEVFSYENDTDPINNKADVTFEALPIVDLEVTKDVDVSVVNVSGKIKFTITVHNYGPCNATNVIVSEILDSHLILDSYNATKGYYYDSMWDVGTLNNGSTETLTLICEVISNGTISNYVSVNGTENDTDWSNNYDNVTNVTALPVVDLEITKVVDFGSGTVKVGDLVQFTINVVNHGPCDATGVNVTEILSPHLQMTSCIVHRGEYNVTEGIWDIGVIPKYDFAQLIIQARVISNGTITNFVVVNSNENDTNESNNNDTIDNITALPSVDLVIDKEVNVSIVTIGDVVEFNITVFNNGPSNATQVNVSEILDNNFRMISNVTSVGYYNKTGGYWYIGNLNNKANATMTIVCELLNDGIYDNYVNVTSYENDTNPYNNWDIVYVSTSPIVDVSITKKVNVTSNIVNVGELIEFTITVHNKGPSDANGVYVSEIITEPLKLIRNTTSKGNYTKSTWTIGKMHKNATETLTLVCAVMYEGNITNYVEVFSGPEPDTNMTNNKDNITNLTAAVNVDVGIIKTANVTGFVNITDLIEFNITVYNKGPCNATDVRVIEILDSEHLELISNKTTRGPYNGYSWEIGTLNKGEELNMTLVVRVKAPGSFGNVASISSFENDTNRTNNIDSIDNITALPLVDLEITKEVTLGGNVVKVGDLVQFTINVTNHGPWKATNVTVVEVLSPHLNMTVYRVYGGDYNVTTGIWDIGDLPNKGFAQLIIQARVISNGTISNVVVINSTENDTNKSNNNDTIDNITALPIVDLIITKDVIGPNVVNVTDKVTFVIEVFNRGPSNATNVNVTEELSKHLKLLTNETLNGYYDVNKSIWYVGNLENGTGAVLTLVCEVVSNGTISNVVVVNSTENETNPDDNHDDIDNITALPIVNLNVTKEVNMTVAYVGDLIKYTINVTNYGPSNATEVAAYDKLDGLLKFNKFTASRDDITYNNITGKITIGKLNVNETVTLTIIAEVIGNGTIPNAVVVDSHENETNPEDNNDTSDNVTALPLVDLEIIKVVDFGNGTVKVGDLVQFTINVTNHGPSMATNVTVVEALSPHLSMTTHLVYGGKYNVTTGIWDIGDLPNKGFAQLIIQARVISNGTISNFVVINSTEKDKNESNNNDTIDNITAVPVVDLIITKDVIGPNVVNVTDKVTFVIEVFNRGPSNATNVNVTEELSKHLKLLTNETLNGHYDVDKGIWYVGNLENGTGAVLTLVCEVVSDGIISNVVAVNSTENETNPDDNHDDIDNITALPIVNLNVTKEVNMTVAYVGDLIKYTINVTNYGPSNATEVAAYDKLSNLLKFNKFTASRDDITYNNITGKITIGKLNVNETVTLVIIAEVAGNGTIPNAIIVDSHENETHPEDNNDTSDNVTALPLVDLEITKEVTMGGKVVNVGDLVQFTINVTNHGPSMATNVTVVEALSPHLSMTTHLIYGGKYNVTTGIWDIGDLPNKGFAQLIIQARVISNGTISNFVIVNSTEKDKNESDNNDTIDNITAVPVVDLIITKDVIGQSVVNVTDKITFIIKVFNKGPSNATNVNVTEELSKHLKLLTNETEYGYYDVNKSTWFIGTLVNGSTAVLTLECEVISNGTISNFVVVNSTENETNPDDNHDDIDNITALPIVNLNVTKEVNMTVAYVGDLIKYTINVTNYGPSNATEVAAYDKLSNLLKFNKFTASRDDITYNNITGKITIGKLNVNETVTLVIIAEVAGNGTIPNAVVVDSHENETDPDDNNDTSDNVTAIPVVNLVVVKYSNVTGHVNVTGLVKFTINVTNKGPSNATWVVITDELNPAFKFINATGNWTRTGQKVTWTIPRINNGVTVSVDLIVRVLTNGTFENVAVANSTENKTESINKTNVTANPIVDLKINKTVNTTKVHMGDYIKYTIIVVNNGPSNATDVYATDNLSNLLQFISFTSSRSDITYDNATGRITIGNLKANETVVLTIIAKVEGLGTIPNVVNVTGHENDTDPDNNEYPCENVTASKLDTPIFLHVYDIHYGDDEIMTVTLPKGATGTVNITVNGILYDGVPINDGKAVLPLSDLGGGDYHVDVVYGGDGNYLANSTFGDFKVLPLTPTIRIEVVDIWHGEVEVLNVTVNAPGSVNITVNGMTIEIPLDHQTRYTDVLASSADKLSYDGKATWVLINLPVGRYPAFAIYNGNENYTSVSTSDVFYVKDKPSTVIVTAEDIYVGEDALINIQVGPIGFNSTVNVTVDGKVYNNVKLVNGKASLTVSGLKAGLKHVHVMFGGDILYRPSQNSTTFNVLKFKPPVDIDAPTIEVGKDGVITVTVPEDATGTVTIVVEGKTYTQPVKDGKAVFIVPGLKVGIHDIEAFYSGDDKYLPNNATGTIEVTPINGSDDGNHSHRHGIDLTRHETGNPLLILLIAVLSVGFAGMRKFKK